MSRRAEQAWIERQRAEYAAAADRPRIERELRGVAEALERTFPATEAQGPQEPQLQVEDRL